jgi:PAS domain S-box-containing protein
MAMNSLVNRMSSTKTDRDKKTAGILNRIPLNLKMIAVTIVVGLSVLILSDMVLTNTLNDTLLKHFDQMLMRQAKENRMFFSAYLKNFKGAVKTISITASFRDYLDNIINREWSTENNFRIKYYSDVPPWLPKPSVLRSFVHLDYVMLLDNKNRVREVYMGNEEELPEALLNPSRRLLRLSQGQSFLTTFDGEPFMVRSETVMGPGQKQRALIVIASPINTYFLVASQGKVNPDHMLALVEGNDLRIISSSHPHLFPEGTTLESLEDIYLIDKVEKVFFDLGASELQMQIASFVNKKEFVEIARSITLKERKLRTAGTAILIFAFVLLMIWITGNIRKLTRRVIDFSRNIGGKSDEDQDGDELFILNSRFQQLTGEIKTSHMAMQQYSESLRVERDRAQNYLDIAGAIIVALNTQGDVILINKKGCEVFGYNENEMIGKNWFSHFLPEQIRDTIKSGFDKMLEGTIQPMEYIENPVLNRDGEERFIAWHNTILKEENKIIGTLSSGEDITERKRLEKALLEIEDRERQHIGYELHDSLGQLLTGISFKNRSLHNNLKNRQAPEAEEVSDIGSLINEAKIQTKMLAQGLSPIGTEGRGLMSALEGLATNTQRLFNIRCTFTFNEPVQLKNEKAILPLYRIAQEAVTNAVRHSQCGNIEILLGRDEDIVTITIRDDGTGMNGVSESRDGMGLKIMHYRASMIGATLGTELEEGKGTVITCAFTDDIT